MSDLLVIVKVSLGKGNLLDYAYQLVGLFKKKQKTLNA